MSLKSPQFFFFALLTVISIAIGATFLLANDMRNLRQLLLRFDLELPRTETPVPVVKEQAEAPREVANRPDGIKVPERLFADFGVPEQTFARTILTRPEAICDRLRDAGFSGMERRQALSREGWECSVLKTVGGGDAAEGTASSIFVFIRVDGREDRVESFRVKINIERPDERNETLALAVRAADVFLRFVRWDASGEITQRIAALDTFDVTRFGSRIRLMREMGDVPRYNFFAAELPKPKPKRPFDAFFDRDRWLPVSDDAIRLPAGFSAGVPTSMPLPRAALPGQP
ncbi:DUF6030 family protein [Rhizobium sp. SG2393]|uniref:DUF6030 family protein n=1 Tax=Rhizobium sp. SG2393 TaxID=3276279 RepID=UPI003671D051